VEFITRILLQTQCCSAAKPLRTWKPSISLPRVHFTTVRLIELGPQRVRKCSSSGNHAAATPDTAKGILSVALDRRTSLHYTICQLHYTVHDKLPFRKPQRVRPLTRSRLARNAARFTNYDSTQSSLCMRGCSPSFPFVIAGNLRRKTSFFSASFPRLDALPEMHFMRVYASNNSAREQSVAVVLRFGVARVKLIRAPPGRRTDPRNPGGRWQLPSLLPDNEAPAKRIQSC
jgi:hypothetical protein